MLGQCQSIQKPERQAAEATLRKMVQAPGFGIVCLRFATVPEVPGALKQAACVAFKNMVKVGSKRGDLSFFPFVLNHVFEGSLGLAF